MGDRTGIEWCDATWNPVTGCTKVSAGCKFCYAERDFHRPYPGRDFADVRMHPDRLEIPLRWRRPRRIFVCSMSDLFQDEVPAQFVVDIFRTMFEAKHHTYQILTKRPSRMLNLWTDFLQDMRCWPAPEHVWLGISCENQEQAELRIPLLLQTPAAVRWVSLEPLLGPIDLHLASDFSTCGQGRSWLLPVNSLPVLDWVVVGGESGPHARPSDLAWFRSARDQCRAAGVAFFMKQITERGRKIPFQQWPADLQIREFPQ